MQWEIPSADSRSSFHPVMVICKTPFGLRLLGYIYSELSSDFISRCLLDTEGLKTKEKHWEMSKR